MHAFIQHLLYSRGYAIVVRFGGAAVRIQTLKMGRYCQCTKDLTLEVTVVTGELEAAK